MWLAQHMNLEFDKRLEGLTAATAQPMFSTEDEITPDYDWSADLWGLDLRGLTALSPWNGSNYSPLPYFGRPVMAITRQHAVMANHAGIDPTQLVRFVGRDGTVYDVAVVDSPQRITGLGTWAPCDWTVHSAALDLAVIKFVDPLPDAIEPVKVLPANVGDYLADTDWVPLAAELCNHSGRKLGVHGCLGLWLRGAMGGGEVDFGQNPTAGQQQDFYIGAIGGDSGGPLCAVVNGQLALVSTFFSAGAGPNYVYYHDTINQVLAYLGGGQQLTDVRLYPPVAPQRAVRAMAGSV